MQIDPALCMRHKDEFRNLEKRSPLSWVSHNEDAPAVEPPLRAADAVPKRHSVVGGQGPQGGVFRSAAILAARVLGATLVVARQGPFGRSCVAGYLVGAGLVRA